MKPTNNAARQLPWLLLVLLAGLVSLAPTPCSLKIAEYPGSSEKEGREGTCDVYAVDHEIVQPIDLKTGQATSTRQHRPLTVLKVIDKATPGFHKALCTGQTLKNAILDFYRIDPQTRQEAIYYTITLTQVRIVGMKTMVPTTSLAENASYGHMEEVRMVYEQIEWKWLPDNVVEADRWRVIGPGAALAVPSTTEDGSPPTGMGTLMQPSSLRQNSLLPMPAPSAKPTVRSGARAD